MSLQNVPHSVLRAEKQGSNNQGRLEGSQGSPLGEVLAFFFFLRGTHFILRKQTDSN